MEDWESRVPVITGALGYAGVCMPPKFDAVHVLDEMHADPLKRRLVGGLSARATTARPLVVGRTDKGTWLVLSVASMDVLGIGSTREEALQDAMEHDHAPHSREAGVSPASATQVPTKH
ncbi:MAG: hypothetical protein HY332_25795 [Chloroflexi bacterium]|nr:hypothetical protein [Chloroflexota bacterium]